jgi:hypothetical protein
VLAPASLRLMVESGPSPAAQAAHVLGEAIGARLEAHVTVLGTGPELSDLGAETESGAEGFDIAILALEPERLPARVDRISLARHHLLLVPGPAALPARILVCVAIGEPGKADVRFAERFAWQLGAQVTVLTVLPESDEEKDAALPPHVERFLEASERMLGVRGVVGRAKVRRGPVLREIRAEIAEGGHDLVVVGAPLPAVRERAGLEGLVERLLVQPPPCPVLVVRRQSGF